MEGRLATCAPPSRHTERVPEPILHHESAGDERAPALLLGCSLGTSLAMWEPQVAPLAERLRVIRYDHRGHGASPVPPGPYEIEDLGRDVLALMDRLGVERASARRRLARRDGRDVAGRERSRPRRAARPLLHVRAPARRRPAWAERAAKVRVRGDDRGRRRTRSSSAGSPPRSRTRIPRRRRGCGRCCVGHRPRAATPAVLRRDRAHGPARRAARRSRRRRSSSSAADDQASPAGAPARCSPRRSPRPASRRWRPPPTSRAWSGPTEVTRLILDHVVVVGNEPGG